MRQINNESLRTDSILPTFRGIYLERFLHLVEGIDSLNAGRQREAVCEELEWCRLRTNGGLDALKYSALLQVLRDLLGQGWRVVFRQHSIFLARPDYTRGKHSQLDPAIVKAQIRESLKAERLAKLRSPSAIRFITALEGQNPGRASIRDLVANGQQLAADLRKLPDHPALADVRRIIRPYLQLIVGEERDVHSGLRLIDVWRYFRYLWSIPYLPTPGRNMYYLIRDGARSHHPIIGIAALGNSVVQLSKRDRYIGWSVDAIESTLQRQSREVVRELPKGSLSRRITETEFLESEDQHQQRIHDYANRTANCMIEALDRELALVNPKGLITSREFAHPTNAVIQRLLSSAASSEKKRQEELRDFQANGCTVRRSETKETWKQGSQSPLYRRKRAVALAEILFAKCVFRQKGIDENPLNALRCMLASDYGRKALRIAIHANKKTKIGSSMMDLIVCGAIPPYAELLGGKLVAMLMTSPQVVHDYATRYGEHQSEIASRLAGRAVVRPADLVFIGTTSLYHVGSSQYERIRIPGPKGSKVTYEFLGHTEGYGTTALSSETTDLLRQVATQMHGLRRVNNVFGEGVSPRLRMVREGLTLIGAPQALVLRHSCPRMIYSVRLARNTLEYLRGEADSVDYIFPPQKFREGTESIIDFWMNRWFLPRSRREESLRKIEEFYKDDLLLGREVGMVDDSALRIPAGGSRGHHG